MKRLPLEREENNQALAEVVKRQGWDPVKLVNPLAEETVNIPGDTPALSSVGNRLF
jgi:hypothetical protein